MENLKFTTEEGSVAVFVNDVQISTMCINTVEDTDNERFLSLIENVEVEEEFQHKGIYTKMLKSYSEAYFQENHFFCSIGRSFEAANFWSKKLDLSLEQTEANEEKDQQERALIINSDLSLNSNEYSPDLFDLFW